MQFDFGNLESPLSGTVFINGNLEPWRDALHSSHKGDSRPSYAVEGMMWVNDTTNPWILNMFDGSNDIAIGTFNTTTNVFTPSGVSQAAEDISFDNTDSGLTATNVQDAIDEAVSDFSDFEGRVAGFATAAQGALADTALQSIKLVSTTKTDTFSASGTSGVFNAITGLTVGITPTNNTKKVLVTVSISVAGGSTGVLPAFKLTRDGVHIAVPASTGSRIPVSFQGTQYDSANMTTTQFSFLDEPSTDLPIVYGVSVGQVGTGSSVTFYVNRSASDTDSSTFARAVSTITAMEV